MKGFWQLVTANVKDIVRDRMSIFWFLAFPLLFILLFGAIFGKDQATTRYGIGLVVEDQTLGARPFKTPSGRCPFSSCIREPGSRNYRRWGGANGFWLW